MRISLGTFSLLSEWAHWTASSANADGGIGPRFVLAVSSCRSVWHGVRGGLSLTARIAAALAGWQSERGPMKAMTRWIIDTTRF